MGAGDQEARAQGRLKRMETPMHDSNTAAAGAALPSRPSAAPGKVVLAYSGGLDTSVILKWLQDTYRCEVVTFTADIGQR